MKSMTGFGSSSRSRRDFKVEIHIKTLNSRFLDIKFLVPSFYISLEAEFKKAILQKCTRGYVTVLIERSPKNPPSDISLKWNKLQALRWKKLYQSLSADLKVKNDMDASHLAALDGVVQPLKKSPSLSLGEKTMVKSAFKEALEHCVRERVREGKVLKKDIFTHIQKLSLHLNNLKQLNRQQKEQVLSRKTKTANSEKMEKTKFDFHEEIIRLKEHTSHFKKILGAKIPAAKKLDFYTQELLREFNTIGSKSFLSASTLEVVEGKFVVEKIKELVQNLE